jgi:hypothetical protein
MRALGEVMPDFQQRSHTAVHVIAHSWLESRMLPLRAPRAAATAGSGWTRCFWWLRGDLDC